MQNENNIELGGEDDSLQEELEQEIEEIPGRKIYKWQLLIISLLGLLLYIQTYNYEYCLDDKLVITHNSLTKKGFAGIQELATTDFLIGFFGRQKNLLSGGRYRPLSLITYAMEAQLCGSVQRDRNGNPVKDADGDVLYVYNGSIGHIGNALLYALTGLLLFIVLRKIFPPKDDDERNWWLDFSFLVSLLYIVHPLHTEVVANIKGRDEIMSLVFALASLYHAIRYANEKQMKDMIWCGVHFMLGLLSKEVAVAFLGVIPLTLYYFSDNFNKTRLYNKKKIFLSEIPDYVVKLGGMLVGTLLLYVGIRLAVLGGTNPDPIPEIMNNPFLWATSSERFATIFFTMGIYIKLLFFPHPLTHDYYPWHPLGEYNSNTDSAFPYMHWSDPGAMLSLFFYAAILFIAIKGLKKKTVTSYAIWMYLGTFFLVTNLIFPVGTLMNERFMYVPTIGWAILVVHFLLVYLPTKVQNVKKHTRIVTLIMLIIVVSYSGKTISRNTSWFNDYTLSVGDVDVSFLSAKSNMSAGLALVDESKKEKDPATKEAMVRRAIKHLERSLIIYPTYIQPMLIMGNAYYEVQEYDKSIVYFRKCLGINPKYQYALTNLKHIGELCTQKKLFDVAAMSYEQLCQTGNGDLSIYSKIGELYGKNLGNLPKAVEYLTKAYEIDQANSDVIQKLGVALAMSGKHGTAIQLFENALKEKPDNAHILMNLGITYTTIGQKEKGQAYLDKAFELDPSLKS